MVRPGGSFLPMYGVTRAYHHRNPPCILSCIAPVGRILPRAPASAARAECATTFERPCLRAKAGTALGCHGPSGADAAPRAWPRHRHTHTCDGPSFARQRQHRRGRIGHTRRRCHGVGAYPGQVCAHRLRVFGRCVAVGDALCARGTDGPMGHRCGASADAGGLGYGASCHRRYLAGACIVAHATTVVQRRGTRGHRRALGATCRALRACWRVGTSPISWHHGGTFAGPCTTRRTRDAVLGASRHDARCQHVSVAACALTARQIKTAVAILHDGGHGGGGGGAEFANEQRAPTVQPVDIPSRWRRTNEVMAR